MLARPPVSSPPPLSELLHAAADGDAAAEETLLPLLYDELRRLAHHLRRGEAGQTLQTTEVVHEAFLRLAQADELEVRDRRHFMHLAARTMRRVLVDAARRRRADKRGGGARPGTLDGPLPAAGDPAEILALDDALDRLTTLSPRLGRVVELRYFGGFSIEETADALAVGRNTVNRDWAKARAWLYRELAA